MSAIDREEFPRAALLGAGLLIAVNLVLVGAVQISKIGAPPRPDPVWADAEPVEARALRFDGDRVVDADSGRLVAELGPTDGFVRTVIETFAFERDKHGLATAPVFRLTRWADGRWSIEDVETDTRINLGAFGEANKSAFYKLLDEAPQ